MFSWITGPRITNVIEDLQPESNYESTFIEPPETPAHQFAVKAFKHAIFGTPAPDDANEGSTKAERKAKLDLANAKNVDLPAPKEDTPPLSPSKQPGGILMTPGTSRGRKTVSFGSQVVDNEGKRVNIGKSGIPNDCPGKFPSPWTPGTQLKLDSTSDKRPRTKLTEALLDARTTTQPKSGQKPKARDDSDITIDLGAPRSESGKYWKEQYESYAERSEKEMKKVIAKQQLAKKFAMKKDGEVTELATKLEQERKRFRQRERELEQQNKSFEDRLHHAAAESAAAKIEVAALKARVATLERSITMPSSECQSRAPFQIFEDAGREAIQCLPEQDGVVETPFNPSNSMASSSKENSSPKPGRNRRQSMPDRSTRSHALPKLGTAEGELSVILGKSPHAHGQISAINSGPILEAATPEQAPKSPLRIRRTDPSKENTGPMVPVTALPSSPLPMPSPDPWLDMQESSIPQVDRMAMPGFSGQPYSRPAWNPPPRQHRSTKSVSTAKKTVHSTSFDRRNDNAALGSEKVDRATIRAQGKERPARMESAESNGTAPKISHKSDSERQNSKTSKEAESVVLQPSTDSRFDLSKATSHHAEGSTQVQGDRVELLSVDRKEQARRRLAERKKLRKTAPV
ncbi:spindle pole body formation-associated protein-domain-containing protein [Pyrenochaeta sp. MPI-SDFR-AT-0127]|nr:spindle pole body formation-associated protein-domain-containing protein [Pyrenochaeta sp. MPI-SDFR-AT-0127]